MKVLPFLLMCLLTFDLFAEDSEIETYEVVPLVKLIVAPEPYADALVSTYGYLYQGALHLTKDHVMDSTSKIFVQSEYRRDIEGRCGSQYVVATGRLVHTGRSWVIAELEFVEWPHVVARCWERGALPAEGEDGERN